MPVMPPFIAWQGYPKTKKTGAKRKTLEPDAELLPTVTKKKPRQRTKSPLKVIAMLDSGSTCCLLTYKTWKADNSGSRTGIPGAPPRLKNPTVKSKEVRLL